MPQYNVFANPFNPSGSQLSGMVKHYVTKKVADRIIAGRTGTRAYKRQRLNLRGDYVADPSISTSTLMYRGKYSRAGNRNVKRRVSRRPSVRFNRRRRYPLARPLWPLSQVVKLKASLAFSSASTSGAIQSTPVSGLNFLDPFLAGSTQQCLGSDQYATMYNRGTVLKCTVILRLHNEGTTGIMTGISLEPENATPTTFTSFDIASEIPGTMMKMLSPDDDTLKLVKSVSTKRHLRLNNIKDDRDLACTLPGTAPTRDYQINCWWQSIDKTTTNNVEGMIDVYYVVLLWDRIIPARS